MVSGTNNQWKIYHLGKGKPFINVLFINLDDALATADWLNDVFEDYLPILDIYPDADLFGMVKWTVKDGIRIYEAIKLVLAMKRLVTKRDFTNAYVEAGKNVRYWTRTRRAS